MNQTSLILALYRCHLCFHWQLKQKEGESTNEAVKKLHGKKKKDSLQGTCEHMHT